MEDLFIIQPKELTTKEAEHVETDELNLKELNELVAFKEDGISMERFNFIDFVIKDDDKIKVFLVEFEASNLGKSYRIQKGKVQFWRMCEIWNKVKLSKRSRTSKSIFKVPWSICVKV